MGTPKKNTAYVFYLPLTDSASRPDFKAAPTLATGDFKVSTDGGAFGNLATLPTVTPAGGVGVKFSLSSGEMNGDQIMVQCIDAAGAEWDDLLISINTAVNDIDDVDAVVDAIEVDTQAIEVDTADIQGRLPATLVSGRMDSDVGAKTGNVALSAQEKLDVNVEADTALTDYDPPTRTEATSDKDEIVTDLDDVKGTGFVKDTHSLVDIEAFVDLIDDGTSGLAKIATDVAAILVDTTVIGALGAGLSNIPWNSSWDTEVQSEVDDAIKALHLDHLVVAQGTVETSGSNSSTQVQTTLAEATDVHYKTMAILFLDGAEAGQARLIDTYTGATGIVTWLDALTGTPTDSTEFIILPAHEVFLLAATQASIDAIEADTNELQTDNIPGSLSTLQSDTDDIQARLPAALVGGRMDSDQGAKTGNVALSAQEKLDVNVEVDAALDTAIPATPTTDSLQDYAKRIEVDTIAIEVDTADIQSRVPSALVGGRIDATVDGTGMETGAADAILQRVLTEGYNADGSAPTFEQALMGILQALTEFSISGSTLTVKKLDGSTTAMTFTLNDAVNPTSRTRAT